MSDQASFALEKILVVVLGYESLSGPREPYANDVLTLIVGEAVTKRNRAQVLRHAQDELRHQHPWLRKLRLPKFSSAKEQQKWLELLCKTHGLRDGKLTVYSSRSWHPSA